MPKKLIPIRDPKQGMPAVFSSEVGIISVSEDSRGPRLTCILREPSECPSCHRMVTFVVNRGSTVCVECDAEGRTP